MGQKGDKHTNEAQLSTDLLVEKLSTIKGISSKKMFGGHGIFHEGKMFGIVDSKGTIFFKTDESNQDDYLTKGSSKHGKMPYHSLPEDALKDQNALMALAKASIEIAK